MSSEGFKPNLTHGGEKSKQLGGRGKGEPANYLSLVLPDDSMAALGYGAGTRVQVLLGDVWQGDWAAVLTREGRWFTGFAFLAYSGLFLRSAYTDLPPAFFPLDHILAAGRVVRAGTRLVIQAGITLPPAGVDSIRFRFRV